MFAGWNKVGQKRPISDETNRNFAFHHHLQFKLLRTLHMLNFGFTSISRSFQKVRLFFCGTQHHRIIGVAAFDLIVCTIPPGRIPNICNMSIIGPIIIVRYSKPRTYDVLMLRQQAHVTIAKSVRIIVVAR